ncbi:hypothetical protein RIF29_16496 [Crotalaria pallida]|uniref:Uncharacterized protein n=1 Tax=Crotalaria pallida TaxID=3830 RepID=A0AAN9IFL8_CROPI
MCESPVSFWILQLLSDGVRWWTYSIITLLSRPELIYYNHNLLMAGVATVDGWRRRLSQVAGDGGEEQEDQIFYGG